MLVMIIIPSLGNDRIPCVSLMLYSKKPTSYSHRPLLKNVGGRIIYVYPYNILCLCISFDYLFTLDKHFLTISIYLSKSFFPLHICLHHRAEVGTCSFESFGHQKGSCGVTKNTALSCLFFFIIQVAYL
ncbi:hypothetical protein HJG60_010480 [Phyllostomus discolor]|uniref:Uncharacterized protein n=1 Tax=Phyllostomus discolor TaxID=89673 RepID=A0A834AN34_9CHIR|nr:hypothetical protein HJG60_010480 [Phyllostomus discolor]